MYLYNVVIQLLYINCIKVHYSVLKFPKNYKKIKNNSNIILLWSKTNIKKYIVFISLLFRNFDRRCFLNVKI